MATTLELDVEVTQDDIDHGVARSCYECPGARAINRTLDKVFGPRQYIASVAGSVTVYRVDNPKAMNCSEVGPVVFVELMTGGGELSELIRRVDVQNPAMPAQPVSFHLSLHPVGVSV